MRQTLPVAEQFRAAGEPARFLNLSEVQRRFTSEAEWGECATKRYRCRYFSWGQGPPLVFVHGLADDPLSFILPISVLSKDFRCLAYQLPDGRADGARLAKYRHEELVADLLELMDQWRLERAYLFGSSFGSTIVLRALHGHAHRFPRAVLQGGFAERRLTWAERALAGVGCYLPFAMRRFPLRKIALREQFGSSFATRDSAIWDYFVDLSGRPPMAALGRRGLMISRLDLRPLLPAINQPIVLICGDYDPLVSRRCEQELLTGLPHAIRIEIENGGHLPYFSHPEIVAEVTHRFLTPLPCHNGNATY